MEGQTFIGNLIWNAKRIWCELVYRYFIWISGQGSGPEFEARVIFLDTGKFPKWYKPNADVPHHEISGTVFTDYEKKLWRDFFENNK